MILLASTPPRRWHAGSWRSSGASSCLFQIRLAPIGQTDRRCLMPEKLTPEVVDQTADVTLADVTDQDALLAELASLSPIEYDRRHESAAELLGVRLSTLCAAGAAQGSKGEGREVTAQLAAATPGPWPVPVDGAQLLDDLAALYRRYVVLPEGAADMLALWTEHTYAMEAFVITPRLAVVS